MALSFRATWRSVREKVKVYCSPHNQGAAELAEELNGAFSTTRAGGHHSGASRSSTTPGRVPSALGWEPM
eukprot:6667385-Prymnesium_polylepis.1